MIILQWFNPAIWLLKKSLKGIHEFQADACVLSTGADKLEYQKMLLSKCFSTTPGIIFNTFNQSLIKKRITMMSKEKSKKLALVKLALIIPTAVIFSFSRLKDKA